MEAKVKVNAWECKHYVDLYKECLKDGHDVRLVLSGHSELVFYCMDCGKVWRFRYELGSKLWSMPESEVLSPGLRAILDKIKSKRK